MSPLSSALPQLQLKTSQQPRPALKHAGGGAAVMEASRSRRAQGQLLQSRWMEASSPVVVTCLTGTRARWNNWFSTSGCAEDGGKALRLPAQQDAQELSNQCQRVETDWWRCEPSAGLLIPKKSSISQGDLLQTGWMRRQQVWLVMSRWSWARSA